MPVRIENESIILEAEARVVTTAGFRRYAAADRYDTRVVSCSAGRLLTRDQAIDALTIEELPAACQTADDPVVAALREGLR